MPRFRPSLRLTLLLLAALGGLAIGGCESDPVASQVVELVATPAALTFGDLPIGVVDEGVVIVSNRGNAPWVPTTAPEVRGDGFLWRGGCDSPLPPQRSCEARFAFGPRALGAHDGAAVFRAPGLGVAGSDVVVEVALRGMGVPATLVLTPAVIDFGDVLVGSFALADVTIDNGGADVVEVDLALSDPAFVIANQPRRTVRLAPGARELVQVTFHPRQGLEFVGSLTAELCGPGCGPAVMVRGVGAAPRIDANPRTIDFGDIAVGGVGTARVTIGNTGTGVLRLDSVEMLSPTDDLSVTVDAELPVAMAAGETVDAVIRFAPRQGRAALDAALLLYSSDPLSPVVAVPVDGGASGVGLEILPNVAHFGRLAQSTSRELTLVARSVGTTTIHDVTVRAEGNGFSLAEALPPFSLAPGQAVTMVARATAVADAVAAGGSTGRIIVAGGGAVAEGALAFLAGGSGCQPVASIAHSNLGFVPLGSGAAGSVVVDNVGDAPCRLERFEPGGSGLGFDTDFTAAAQGLTNLLPGTSGRVQFGFTATRQGSRSTVVELGFVDVGAPLFVSASAIAIDGSLGTVPPTIDLGPVGSTCSDPDGASALVNDGGVPLEVVAMVMDPPDAPFVVDVGTLPFTLLPGASRGIAVSGLLNRASIGTSTATVTFTTGVSVYASVQLTLEVTAEDAPGEERFTSAPVLAVDIIFVVDNSGSMQDDQQLLADNFAAFLAGAATSGLPDFQLGVTTTDVLSPNSARGELVGEPGVLTSGTPGLAALFGDRVQVGVDGAGLELGLEAARLAFEHPANSGFLRRDAALSLIFVTDEDDGGGIPELLPDASLSRAPSEYMALLQSLKTGSVGNTPIMVSGVLVPGAAPRYEVMVRAFGGTVLDIGTPDWGSRLSDIGRDTFSLTRRYTLVGVPLTGTMTVTVDGRPTTDFVLDVERNTVILDAAPRAGAEVVVRYQSDC